MCETHITLYHYSERERVTERAHPHVGVFKLPVLVKLKASWNSRIPGSMEERRCLVRTGS